MEASTGGRGVEQSQSLTETGFEYLVRLNNVGMLTEI